jgi:hypothetical protein
MSHPEVFNLERKQAMEEHIDPTGKKWEIKGERGSALVHARPNPDRSDMQIPKDFSGKWTSPSVLREKITLWLNKQWDMSERKAQRAHIVEHQQKITPEESLDALPQEIKDELGITDDHSSEATEAPQEAVSETGEGSSPEASQSDSPTGRISDAGSEREKKEVDYASMDYQRLLAIAKERGINARKKVDILEALDGGS